jgi:hypothetical protein
MNMIKQMEIVATHPIGMHRSVEKNNTTQHCIPSEMQPLQPLTRGHAPLSNRTGAAVCATLLPKESFLRNAGCWCETLLLPSDAYLTACSVLRKSAGFCGKQSLSLAPLSIVNYQLEK